MSGHQGRRSDQQTYLNGILTASLVSEAINAYDASRYREALDLYVTAEKTPAGNQLRVFNGLYLTNWKLGHRDQAEEAFGHVVDYGLENNALGVKILFRPGTTVVRRRTGDRPDRTTCGCGRSPTHSASRKACLQVTGNSSPSGSAVLNDQLSQLRAEYVKGRLETDAPAFRVTSLPRVSDRRTILSAPGRMICRMRWIAGWSSR